MKVLQTEIAYAEDEVMVMAEKKAKSSITFKMDSVGRLVASKTFRDKLHTGDIVEIGEGVIKIKPNKKAEKEPTAAQIEAMRLLGEKAIEDFKAGKTIPFDEVVRRLGLD